MSGPGGPASAATTAVPATGGGLPAQEIQRIKANVYKMLNEGRSRDDVNRYLSAEGTSAEALRNNPVASPGQITGATPEVKPYNPSLMDRAADLLRARVTGTGAPSLPNDAGIGLKALGALDTFGRAGDVVAHGMTAGLTDEAGGAGAALATQIPGSATYGQPAGEAFNRASQAENANIAQFHQQHPAAGAILEGGGMLFSPLSRAGMQWQAQGPTWWSRALRAGGAGAGLGVTTGVGYSQGDIGDRIGAGVEGGIWGGLLGLGTAPLAEATLGGGTGFYNAVQAKRNAALQARRLTSRAIDQDAMTPLPIEGETLATTGGPNVQRLARSATVAPGNANAVATNYFNEAAANRYDVIGQAVRGNLSGRDYLSAIDDLTRQQRAAAGPAYDAFYAVDPERFATPFFSNLANSSVGRRLLTRAYRIAGIEQARGEIPENPLQYLLDAEGNVSTRQSLSPRAVDYMKRALDDEIAGFRDPITGRIRGEEGHALEQLRRSFLTEADRASEVGGASLYQQARQAYSGPAALRDAADAGRNALGGGQLTGEKIATFNRLSPLEQDWFRSGLAAKIIEKAGEMGPNTDPVQVFLKGENARELIRAYLPTPEAYDDFARALLSESRKVQAQRTILGGSPTARIHADMADATLQENVGALRDVWNATTGSIGEKFSSVLNLARRAQNWQRGMSEPVATELGNVLFNPSALQNRATLSGLRNLPGGLLSLPTQNRLQRGAGLLAPFISAQTGATIGGPR